MRKQIEELRAARAKMVAEGRAIVGVAEKEGRGLNAEEESRWDRCMKDVDDHKARIDRMERQLAADAEPVPVVRAPEQRTATGDDGVITLPDGRIARIVQPGESRRVIDPTVETRHEWESPERFATRQRRSRPEYTAAVNAYFQRGEGALHAAIASRAIQADNDIVGGYLVMPQAFTDGLIKFLDDAVYIRSKATKLTSGGAQSLGCPSFDTDISDADWTSELATGSEDSSMRFGKRELTPHPLAKRVKASNKILRNARIPGGAEGFVRGRLGYKFGTTEEAAFLTGNGSQQPLGVYTASTRGISTGRDVVCGSSTNFTADGLIDVKYSLKAQYQSQAEWMVHRQGMKRIRKLKDGDGQYLWSPGLASNGPDTMLDRPVVQSEFNPSTFTASQYVIILGVWSFYWIVDGEDISVQRLNELYAETNQTGFIARRELDGMPVLEEAFARGILSA